MCRANFRSRTLVVPLMLLFCFLPRMLYAQGDERYRVLVTPFHTASASDDAFGREVADRIRKQLDWPTHRAVSARDTERALRSVGIDDTGAACPVARTAARQIAAETLLCGSYETEGQEKRTMAQFIDPRSGESHDLPMVTTNDPVIAGDHIVRSAQNLVQQYRHTVFCGDYLADGQLTAALRECDRALSLGPALEATLYLKGNALVQADSLHEARRILSDLLQRNPRHQRGGEAFEALLLYEAKALFEADSLIKARERLTELLQRNPRNEQGLETLKALNDLLALRESVPAASPGAELPTYSIEKYCESVSQTAGGSYQIKAACKEQEHSALGEIRALEEIEHRIKNYCDQVSQAVGGSYQIFVTCVRQELDAKRRSRER